MCIIKSKKYCSAAEIPCLLKEGEVLPVCSCKGGIPISLWKNCSSAQVSCSLPRKTGTASKNNSGQQWWQVQALCWVTALSAWYLSAEPITSDHSLEKSEVWNKRKIDGFLTVRLLSSSLIPMLNLQHRFFIPFTCISPHSSNSVLVAGANQPENGNRLQGSQISCRQHRCCVVWIKDRQSAQVLETSHRHLKSSNNKNIHDDHQIIGKMKMQTL